MIYFNAILFVLMASFVKCIVDSKINKDFFVRRSRCTNCHTNLSFFDLIPFFSYLFLRGKCRYCSKKIPITIFLYELSSVIVALIYIFTYNHAFLINYIDYWTVLILIFIAIEDINTYEINVKLQLILLLILVINFFYNFSIQQLITFIILTLFFNIIYLLTREGIGYGDIKLFSSLSLSLSLIEGVYLFAYTFVYAGFVALYLIIVKKESKGYKVALAPYICLAYITVLLQKEISLW